MAAITKGRSYKYSINSGDVTTFTGELMVLDNIGKDRKFANILEITNENGNVDALRMDDVHTDLTVSAKLLTGTLADFMTSGEIQVTVDSVIYVVQGESIKQVPAEPNTIQLTLKNYQYITLT